AINEVHFSLGKKTFLFDQFDLRFNRPDIVLQRMGYADSALLEAYKKAWEKRVQKMGFDPSLFVGHDVKFNTPDVVINKSLPASTNESSVIIDFTASDKLYPIDRLHIYQNGTPVFGSKGKIVKLQNKKNGELFEVSLMETVTLISGKNVIELSATNEQGIESLRERFEINYQSPTSEKHDLYIVAIGVSEFIDNSMNLTYAAKDANDLVSLFESEKEKYAAIHIFKFTNQQATRVNVLKVKNDLLKSKIDDEVILFVASHGLLDNQLDYYVAMHDMVFENPASKGLKYEELEGLLDSIPALKKLMLIDACHSGEVDKEESEIVAVDTQNTYNGVSSRGFKALKNKSGIGLKTSFELMMELFTDLRRGNGAMVISSASGKEFSYESSKWKNGVFSYAVLESLSTEKADIDNNHEISVSELRDYVFVRVKELTNGQQNPTSRKENLEFDFRVW
ncbi:MAG: caspase family protein, partial [Bacteroidota bacterium]